MIRAGKWGGRSLTARTFILLVTSAVAVTSACSDAERSTPPPAEPTEISLSPNESATAPITDTWDVTVPAGSVPASGAVLTVSPQPFDAGSESPSPKLLSAADISLSSGQPLQPVTFTLKLDEPLDQNSRLFLLDDTGTSPLEPTGEHEPTAATLREPVLSQDRMTATAEVDHLSTKAWWEVAIDDAAFFLTSVAGQRTSPPTCEAQPRPDWIEDALFLDEQNAPLRVCTGVDPNDPDIAVVKIKNNRGGAMVVTAPVTPTWAAVNLDSTSGAVSPAITDIFTLTSEALGVPSSERDRSWVLPPGGGVDIGFTRDSLAPMNGIAPITAKFSTASATYGLIWKLLSDVFDDPTYLTAFGLGLIAVCANDSANDALAASNPVEFGAAAAQIAKCGVESGPTIIKTIERLVSRDVWTKISGSNLNKLINTAKSKLLLLTAAEAAVTVTDLLGTLALDSAAFTITIFTVVRTAAPKVVLGSSMGGNSAGYGTEAPATISLGSCANAISTISWDSWGGPNARGVGTGCVQTGTSPRYTLIASDLGLCKGVVAYRSLQIGPSSPQSICR
jgi:hypothetical protein